MNHLTVISNPTHTPQNRSVQPIDFIQHWSLCRDLGEVIIRLERASHLLHEDADASSYVLLLARFHLFDKYLGECIGLSMRQKDVPTFRNAPLFQRMRTSPFPMMAESVAKEWGLSNHLKEVVFHITLYKNFYRQFPYMRPVFLKQALKHLDREMDAINQFITLTKN